MSKVVDLTGRRFGRLVVESIDSNRKNGSVKEAFERPLRK